MEENREWGGGGEAWPETSEYRKELPVGSGDGVPKRPLPVAAARNGRCAQISRWLSRDHRERAGAGLIHMFVSKRADFLTERPASISKSRSSRATAPALEQPAPASACL